MRMVVSHSSVITLPVTQGWLLHRAGITTPGLVACIPALPSSLLDGALYLTQHTWWWRLCSLLALPSHAQPCLLASTPYTGHIGWVSLSLLLSPYCTQSMTTCHTANKCQHWRHVSLCSITDFYIQHKNCLSLKRKKDLLYTNFHRTLVYTPKSCIGTIV